MILDENNSIGDVRSGNSQKIFSATTRGVVLIVSLLLLSFIYLNFLSDVLQKSTDPCCVESSSTIEVDIRFFGTFRVECKNLTLNEVGDYFAGLVSLLATAWLVVAFIWQALELSFQRHEFQETNRISIERADSENTWKKIEYYEMLREKLKRSVNELLVVNSILVGGQKPKEVSVMVDLMQASRSYGDKIEEKNYDIARKDEVERYNELVEVNLRVRQAIEKLEKDKGLIKYVALIN